MTTNQLPVTERALVQRLNRALIANGLLLRKSRAAYREKWEIGTWYVIDARQNRVICPNVDLKVLAAEWDVIAGWEILEE